MYDFQLRCRKKLPDAGAWAVFLGMRVPHRILPHNCELFKNVRGGGGGGVKGKQRFPEAFLGNKNDKSGGGRMASQKLQKQQGDGGRKGAREGERVL